MYVVAHDIYHGIFKVPVTSENAVNRQITINNDNKNTLRELQNYIESQ